MKITFVHRSDLLVISTVVKFRKGRRPEKGQLQIHWCDFNADRSAVEKEFAQWITHVWTESERAGAKVNWGDWKKVKKPKK